MNKKVLKSLITVILLSIFFSGCTKSFRVEMLYGKWKVVELMPIYGKILYDDEDYVSTKEGSILEYTKTIFHVQILV